MLLGISQCRVIQVNEVWIAVAAIADLRVVDLVSLESNETRRQQNQFQTVLLSTFLISHNIQNFNNNTLATVC